MPVNNRNNRRLLAEWIALRVDHTTVVSMAKSYLEGVWKSIEGRVAFEADAKTYAGPESDFVQDRWTDQVDDEDLPRYRCRECKDENIEVLVNQHCNSGKTSSFQIGLNPFYCPNCQKSRGDGEIRYPEVFNLATHTWE